MSATSAYNYIEHTGTNPACEMEFYYRNEATCICALSPSLKVGWITSPCAGCRGIIYIYIYIYNIIIYVLYNIRYHNIHTQLLENTMNEFVATLENYILLLVCKALYFLRGSRCMQTQCLYNLVTIEQHDGRLAKVHDIVYINFCNAHRHARVSQ